MPLKQLLMCGLNAMRFAGFGRISKVLLVIAFVFIIAAHFSPI
jgi:hypothetical protein